MIDWEEIRKGTGYKDEKRMLRELYKKFGGLVPLGNYLGVDYKSVKRRMILLGLGSIIKGRGGPNSKGKILEGGSWDKLLRFGLDRVKEMTKGEIMGRVGLSIHQFDYCQRRYAFPYRKLSPPFRNGKKVSP